MYAPENINIIDVYYKVYEGSQRNFPSIVQNTSSHSRAGSDRSISNFEFY